MYGGRLRLSSGATSVRHTAQAGFIDFRGFGARSTEFRMAEFLLRLPTGTSRVSVDHLR